MKLIAVAALLLAVTACGSDGEREPAIAELQMQTCEDVRAGIALFNANDYAGTVEEFVRAEPTAIALADRSSSPDADELLDAVEYYANLAPADYPEAARSSADFAKYKAITLGQCTDGTPIDKPTDDGTPI